MEVAANHIKTKFKVAERLLQGPATISEIARDTGILRQTIWHYLNRFVENGVVERRLTDEDTYVYAVIDPENFMQKVEHIKITPRRGAEAEGTGRQQPVFRKKEKPSCNLCHSREDLLYYSARNSWYICGICLLEVRSMLDAIMRFQKSLSEQVSWQQA